MVTRHAAASAAFGVRARESSSSYTSPSNPFFVDGGDVSERAENARERATNHESFGLSKQSICSQNLMLGS
jgi:hypothetical protein